jgi:retinol dehydrogenase 12
MTRTHICLIVGWKCNVEISDLDLASMDSIHAFSQEFLSRNVALNILVLNAGIMAVPFEQSVDGFEMQFAVNYLGHFFLTQSLRPSLEQGRGRVVAVSSSAHAITYEPEGIRFDNLNNSLDYDPWFFLIS